MSEATITSETTVGQLEEMLRERSGFIRVRLWGPEVRCSFDATRPESKLHEKLGELFARTKSDEEPDPIRVAVESMRGAP